MEPDERQRGMEAGEQKKNQDDWDVLKKFLGTFGDDAHALAREELSVDEKQSLRSLVAGDLSDQERDALVLLLAANEEAMEFLVGELNERNDK